MEDKQTGSNVIIEVQSKTKQESQLGDEIVEVLVDNTETIEADQLSAEELESLSDDVQNVAGAPLGENPDGLAGEAMSLLGKFKDYIGGDKFDKACEDAANENGVDKQFIKNAFVNNALGTIANALNLTVSVAGDIIKGAVVFIENIICTITNFATSTIHKLVTAVTLNCGTVAY